LVKDALVILFATATLVGCGLESEPPQSEESADLPEQEVVEFSLTETVGGDKSWTLFAERAEVFDNKGFSKVFGVRILFYGPDGDTSSVLTSQRGRVSEGSRDLQAFGNVLLESSEGMTLETESLRWDNQNSKIWSSEFVTVKSGEKVLTGYGFESDPDLKNVQIHSQVKISVREDTDGAGRNKGEDAGEIGG
jgi:LPS export ABC transporter protein LptC